MKTIPIASIVRGPELLWLAFLVFASWSSPSVSFAAEPVDDERRQIENLIGAYYVAVAAEDVDNVVDLHHWENSFERDKVTALVEQAFAVTTSEFERIRVQSIELYPERNVGLARVGVDYVVRNSDRSDAFSGHLDVAVVLVNGRRGWRIGKVGRAADFDLTAAVSQFAAKSQELEKTVQEAPVGMAETPSTVGKLPKLATATVPVVQNPAAETGVVKVGPSAASTTGGLTFFSLRRKTSGECEVVAGVEGIAPGDTIYGAFPDFGRAQEAVSANCTGGQPEAAPPASTAAASPPPTDVSPILALPIYSGDDSTTGIFVVKLNDGSAVYIGKVKGEPRTFRATPVNHNIFTVLGRTLDRPAKPGEILAGEIRGPNGQGKGIFVVETSTGSAVFLEDVGNGPHRVTLRRINGRPAAAIASDDGNFALIMRRDGSGSTDGAYLYHATSGRCVYFAHVDDMAPDTVVEFTSPLPVMEGGVAAIELQGGGEATPQALLIDGGNGRIYRVGELEHQPIRISVTREPLDFFEFFPASFPASTPQRFVLVPEFSGNGKTDAVFVIDAASGRMAALRNVFRGGGMQLVGSTQNLLGHLPGDDGRPKILAAVPKVGASGTTDGAWVFDSVTDEVLFLENIRDPHNLRIRPVVRQTQ